MNQLEILKNRHSINNYEISADKTTITLYWTYMKKDETKSLDLTFVKKFGDKDTVCQRRASEAYLYYQKEDVVWIKDPSSAVDVMCDIEVFDYIKKEIIADPVPEPAPVIIEEPEPEPMPLPDDALFEARQTPLVMGKPLSL